MTITVRVLYDFEAQDGSGELTIHEGEYLEVTRQDVGDGWWEGINAQGQQGLFPEQYVEPSAAAASDCSAPPSVPPPPLPSQLSSNSAASNGMPQTNRPRISSEADDYDDDWSDDSIVGDNAQTEHTSVGHSSSAGGKTTAARMKSMNIFSNFVKSGMEGYILTPAKLSSQPFEKHEVVSSSDGFQWAANSQAYSCVVDNPKKESKMHGLKSFIAYSLTSSLSGIQVSRRYKHFDWLHERLTEKYILTAIPPLPEKQMGGRYEDDLIEHRKRILQLWVNKICRHPILNKSDVWIHFITCTDDKQWKQGKRKSEKDEYVGGNFFQSVSIPSQSLDSNDVEKQVELFHRMSRSLEDSVRCLFDRANETQKRLIGSYKANYQKMSGAFGALAQSFEMDKSAHNYDITQAIKQMANVYHLIGDLHEQRPRKDLEPLLDALFAYKGTLASIPDIVTVHKSCLSKLRENQRMCQEGKISQSEATNVVNRVDTISYAMLAEINHFHRERVVDFKSIMVDYLREQVDFYQQIAAQLQGVQSQFESV